MGSNSHPKQHGSISLWRFTENERNYPGWHLSADAEGVNSLLSILSGLQLSGGFRTIAITQPTAAVLSVPNNRGGAAAWVAPGRWRINFLSEPDEEDEWHFPPSLESANLTVGRLGMEQLALGVQGLLKGKGDYTIGNGDAVDEVLWFWWRVVDSA